MLNKKDVYISVNIRPYIGGYFIYTLRDSADNYYQGYIGLIINGKINYIDGPKLINNNTDITDWRQYIVNFNYKSNGEILENIDQLFKIIVENNKYILTYN